MPTKEPAEPLVGSHNLTELIQDDRWRWKGIQQIPQVREGGYVQVFRSDLLYCLPFRCGDIV
jgi:hypothetical protein